MAKKRAFPHHKAWSNATRDRQAELRFNNTPKFFPTEPMDPGNRFERRAEAADKRRKNSRAPAVFKAVSK